MLRNEQNEVIAEIIKARDESGNIKEALDKMQTIASEKVRLNRLFTIYAKIPGAIAQPLQDLCDELLSKIKFKNSKSGSGCHGRIYDVRNCLIHEYWRFPDSQAPKVNGVADEFLEVLELLFSTYSTPPP